MADDMSIEVSRTVQAPADRIFALLADPQRHTEIDGSGSLKGSDSERLTEVGQVFTMNMHRDDLGDYRTVNTVTTFEPDARLGWAPDLDKSCSLYEQLSHLTIGGHTYTYALRPVDGGTEVTQVYDWSGVTDPNFAAFCPFVGREELMGTLDRLAESVEEGS